MAAHNCNTPCIELCRKPELVHDKLWPVAAAKECSFTRRATADVINGRKAVTPKTNLLSLKIITNDKVDMHRI